VHPQPLPNVKGVLFDLDGTLLQVEMGDFIPAYIDGLAGHFADVARRGVFDRLVRGAIHGLLTRGDGARSNEAMFLATLGRHLGLEAGECGERLRRYCLDGLDELEPLVRPLPLARSILERCFERGVKVAVATNPVFPRAMIEARLRWGGIADFPFDRVTTFENCRFCKPHPGYFRDLLAELGLAPQECLMVGNDTGHDLAAGAAGISTYLVDTWLVDRTEGDFAADFRGGHADLLHFLDRLAAVA